MHNNTIILQAVRESEVFGSCVGVPLKPAEIRVALNHAKLEFTEDNGVFNSLDRIEWNDVDFTPDWSICPRSSI